MACFITDILTEFWKLGWEPYVNMTAVIFVTVQIQSQNTADTMLFPSGIQWGYVDISFILLTHTKPMRYQAIIFPLSTICEPDKYISHIFLSWFFSLNGFSDLIQTANNNFLNSIFFFLVGLGKKYLFSNRETFCHGPKISKQNLWGFLKLLLVHW